MNRKLQLGLMFLFFWAMPVCGVIASSQATPSVAVLDFESIGSEPYLGKAVAEIMRTELVGTHNFRIVERAQIEKTLEEQKLQMTGLIDNRSAVEVGKLVGADFIVVGSVVKIGNAYTINSRMIDVKTGDNPPSIRGITGSAVSKIGRPPPRRPARTRATGRRAP